MLNVLGEAGEAVTWNSQNILYKIFSLSKGACRYIWRQQKEWCRGNKKPDESADKLREFDSDKGGGQKI